MAVIGVLTALTELNLSKSLCQDGNAEGPADLTGAIRNLKRLQVLDLSWCDMLASGVLACLGECSLLEKLNLQSSIMVAGLVTC